MIENLRINLKGEEKERFLETGTIIYTLSANQLKIIIEYYFNFLKIRKKEMHSSKLFS